MNQDTAPGNGLERWQVYGFILLGIVCAVYAIGMVIYSVPRILDAVEARPKLNERNPE